MFSKYTPVLLIAVLALLTFSSVSAQTNDDVVIGKYLKIQSKEMDEERTMLISVPDDYDKTTDTYPVLYVLDGSVKTMIEAQAAVQMSKYCYAPDMIIVAVVNTVRNRDMLPGTEDAPKFLRFIENELCPYIKNHYRTDDDQKILYGGSNAGLFTCYTFLESPDLFAGYIASSPTICHRKSIMMDKVKALSEKPLKNNRFMYIIWGDVDFPGITDTLAVFIPWLKEIKGLRLKTEYLPEDGHIPFGSLQFGLMAMYEGYPYPADKLENEGLDSIKAYYSRYSKIAGYVQKPPKQKLLFFSQELMRKNKIPEAIEALEYTNKIYPNDYEGTLLLAVAYFKNNSIDYARKDYIKTKEIMNKINEKSDPPIEEWRQMKKKFDS